MSHADFSDIVSLSSSEFDTMTTASSLNTGTSTGVTEDGGVGLSDATLSRSRRKLLDLVNRLHATGYVSLPPFVSFNIFVRGRCILTR
jgi:hypothetical protein